MCIIFLIRIFLFRPPVIFDGRPEIWDYLYIMVSFQILIKNTKYTLNFTPKVVEFKSGTFCPYIMYILVVKKYFKINIYLISSSYII